MLIIYSVFFGLYVILMVVLFFGFKNHPIFPQTSPSPLTSFSVVVPFRNEAENLPKLLESLSRMDYPSALFEIIFVDDASEDNSIVIIDAFPTEKLKFKCVPNLRNSLSPKKDAITTAINIAENEWILTTDADCEVPKNWLALFDALIQKDNPNMVCGPVFFNAEETFVQKFQQLDGLSLQAVTQAGFGLNYPLLCNGANLAYKKEIFNLVQGYKGNDKIASGDDIFLMEKIERKFPDTVKYLKSKQAIVSTESLITWKEVLFQRIRWAGKTSKTDNNFAKGMGLLVFMVNLLIPVGILICIFQSFFLTYWILFLAFKMIVDYFILWQSADFFSCKLGLWNFLISEIVYPFITIYVVFASLKGSYNWKGRNIKMPH